MPAKLQGIGSPLPDPADSFGTPMGSSPCSKFPAQFRHESLVLTMPAKSLGHSLILPAHRTVFVETPAARSQSLLFPVPFIQPPLASTTRAKSWVSQRFTIT